MSNSFVTKFFGTAGLQAANRGLAAILGIVLARVMGPDEFGRYGFIMSLIAIAAIPTIAGMPQFLIREVAHAYLDKRWDELKGILHWALSYIFIISSLIIIIAFFCIYLGLIDDSLGKYLWVGMLLIPLKGISARQNALLNGLRHPILAQLPQGIFTSSWMIFLVFLLLFFQETIDAKTMLLVQVFSCILGVVLSSFFVNIKLPKLQMKGVRSKYKISFWFKSLIPFTLLTFITTMNNEMANVFLGFHGSDKDVAYFRVAMQGVVLLSLGLNAVNAITGPQIARLYRQGDIDATQRLLSKSVKVSCFSALPFAFVFIMFGSEVVSLLFGEIYLPSANLLIILCFGQIVNTAMGSVGLVLQMTGHEKSALRSLFITLIVNVVLLNILIPYFGSVGAAISVTISLIFWNITMSFDVYRKTKLKTWVFS